MFFKNIFGFCNKIRVGKGNEKNSLYNRIVITRNRFQEFDDLLSNIFSILGIKFQMLYIRKNNILQWLLFPNNF